MKAQNHAINFLKLFFLAMIVLHHSGMLTHFTRRGYIGVEFFFMASGYFLYQTYLKKPQMTLPAYTRKRISKLYPHYIFSFAVMALFYQIINTGHAKKFVNHIPELLMLQNIGIFKESGINYPCWYLSVLMYASILVYGFFRVSNKPVRLTLSTVCVLATYLYIFIRKQRLETFSNFFIFHLPFWRGVAGLLLGMLAYEIQAALSKSFFQHNIALTRITECVSFAGIIGLLFVNFPADLIIAFLIFVLIITVSSPYSLINKLADNMVVKHLIKYEYAMFLNHAIVLEFIFRLPQLPQTLKAVLIAAILITYSVLTTKLVDFCFKKINKLTEGMLKKQKA